MSKDNSSSGGFTVIFVVAMIVAFVICGLIGIDSFFLTMLIGLGVFCVLFFMVYLIIIAFEKKEQKKAARIQRQKDEEERKKIIVGSETVNYKLLKEISISESRNYEEECLIKAFNNYIIDKNEVLKIEQHNEFIKNQRNRLVELNDKLGYLSGTDCDKLPQPLSNSYMIDSQKSYMTKNFDKMYKFFYQKKDWRNFVEQISNVKLNNNSKLFCDNVDSKFADFFNGYDYKAINLGDDKYLFFFPCYIINLCCDYLRVIKYSDLKIKKSLLEKKSKERDFQNYVRTEWVRKNGELNLYYINKVSHINIIYGNIKKNFACKIADSFVNYYNTYLKIFSLQANSKFFEQTFSISEEDQQKFLEEQRKLLEEKRIQIISFKEPLKYDILESPCILEKYSNIEEFQINKSWIDFISLKNENIKIEQFNEFVRESTSELITLNKELGYSDDKDIDKLPESKKSITLKSKGCLPENFVQLYDYFSSKKEWNNFISRIQKCKCTANKNLIGTAIESLYKEFFDRYNINSISLDDNNHLLLFPCYIIYIQKSKTLEVISYEKLKVSLDFVDKTSEEKSASNGKIVAQEYTYQNLDGSPNRRYKSNPIIYTVRYFSLIFSFKGHIRRIPCKDAEVFLEYFNEYKMIFKDKLNSFIMKSIFNNNEYIDLKTILSDYKDKEKKEQEKIKKQAEIAEKKRLQEEKAKEEEERQKKLAIIQKQKERNEEMLRKKELERNAMKLFGEDITDDCEENFDSNSEASASTQTTAALSVLSECLITNNVFKVELRQEIDTAEQEYSIVFVDFNKTPISNKRSIKKVAVGEKIVTGITLLSNIDFTTMKKCFMQIEANGEVIAEIPFKMNIAFYSDF